MLRKFEYNIKKLNFKYICQLLFCVRSCFKNDNININLVGSPNSVENSV